MVRTARTGVTEVFRQVASEQFIELASQHLRLDFLRLVEAGDQNYAAS